MLGLRYYDDATDRFKTIGHDQLDHTFAYTLHIDPSDNLWCGTSNKGIFRIDASTGKITAISKQSGKGLKEDYVICLYCDSRGLLWIGTNNSGLQYLDTKTGQIGTLAEERLSRCTICSIEEAGDGMLWISSSQGLFRYDATTKAVSRFSAESSPLPSNYFNYSSSLRAADGSLLFGTTNGLVCFRPERVRLNNGPFYVHLMQYDDTDRIVLSHKEAAHFVVDYGVIMPGNSSTIMYQLWIEGIDKTWRNVYDERRFSTFNLPTGTYRLHIRANNTTQGWEQCPDKVVTIVVRPPFYRSPYAYALYLALLALAVWFARRLFLVRMREKEAVRRFQLEKEKISELDRVRQNFFNIAAHELKTPLSLIIAPLKSIPEQGLSQQQQKNLGMAIKNAAKMEQLVGELITFNKVQTDSFPFYLQKGNPLDFIERFLQPFRLACAAQGLTLTLHSENNGEDVWFSPSYLEHILNNLMSNAMKFTESGGTIGVKARITPAPPSSAASGGTSDARPSALQEAQGQGLQLEVSDTGLGIEPDELPNIFDPYYQTKRGHNANSNGWGIGLALVKHLAHVQQGHVSVQSTVGQGTTFTVWLNASEKAYTEQQLIRDDTAVTPVEQYQYCQPYPLTPNSQLLTPNSKLLTPNSKLQTPNSEAEATLLIVDDNSDLISFLADYFAPRYNVVTATNGDDALRIAREGLRVGASAGMGERSSGIQQPQLLIADVMMPGIDGIELCRRLKGDMLTSHIPVILLTAKVADRDVMEGYRSGAEAYVQKPFDPQILQLQVNNILQLVKRRQQLILERLRAGEHSPAIGDTETEETQTLSDLDKRFIEKMNSIVEDNIANSDFSIADITTALAISRSLLHVKMKSNLGMSMGDYIRKKRLDKAQQMLRQGHNVSETAYATGFADPNYFSKTFKKHLGISPTDFIHSSPA